MTYFKRLPHINSLIHKAGCDNFLESLEYIHFQGVVTENIELTDVIVNGIRKIHRPQITTHNSPRGKLFSFIWEF